MRYNALIQKDGEKCTQDVEVSDLTLKWRQKPHGAKLMICSKDTDLLGMYQMQFKNALFF